MRDSYALPALGHNRSPDTMLQAEPRQLVVMRAEHVICLAFIGHPRVTYRWPANSRTEFRQRILACHPEPRRRRGTSQSQAKLRRLAYASHGDRRDEISRSPFV